MNRALMTRTDGTYCNVEIVDKDGNVIHEFEDDQSIALLKIMQWCRDKWTVRIQVEFPE